MRRSIELLLFLLAGLALPAPAYASAPPSGWAQDETVASAPEARAARPEAAASAFRGRSGPAAAEMLAAAVDASSAVRPSAGPAGGGVGGGPDAGRPPRDALHRSLELDASPGSPLGREAARAAAVRRLRFGAADALTRAGLLSWRTTAPPPSRRV